MIPQEMYQMSPRALDYVFSVYSGARSSADLDKDTDLDWQQAEDTFLRLFCEIDRQPWGAFYGWAEGGDWPKFNFLRLLQPQLPAEDFLKIVAQYRPWFQKHDKTLSVKVPSRVSLSREVQSLLSPTPGSLVSLAIVRPLAAGNLSKSLQIVRCESEQDLAVWWDINSDGRARTGASPLWPVVQSALKQGSHFFYLREQGAPVSCGALTGFAGGMNLWGLATRKEHQRKGLMSALVSKVLAGAAYPVYLQVLEDSLTHRYFTQALGAREVSREKRYEIRLA